MSVCLPTSGFPSSRATRFPVLCFRLLYLGSACFLSLYPAWLPQPLRQVITWLCCPRCFPLPRPFFRPSRSDSYYSDFRFSLFPSSRPPLTVVLPVPNLSAFRLPVSMHPSGFGTQHAASSVLRRSRSPHSGYASALPFLSGWLAFLGFRFRIGLLGFSGCTLKTEHHYFFCN